MTKTRLIDRSTIEQLISFELANQVVDQTFQAFGHRHVKNPTKVTLDLGQNSIWPAYHGYMNAMPAYIKTDTLDIAGLKWVGGFDGKRKAAGFPYINGLILLIDPQMGTFEAILDGSLITNYRTGSQSTVSLKYLGFTRNHPFSLGLFGTGAQASTQVQALTEWFTIKELKIWDYQTHNIQDFIKKHQSCIDGPIQIVKEAKDACDADVIITATKSNHALFQPKDLSGDTIIIPIGSGHEIDNQIIKDADRIIVDHVAQALHRGALADAYRTSLIDEDTIDTTIGNLAAGNTQINQLKGLTLCVPIGMGALDIALAGTIYQMACQNELGAIYEFSPF